MQPANDARLINAHRMRYGCEPGLIARSPGRVNIIGEHIDYADGIVLPMPIDLWASVCLSASPAHGHLRVQAIDLDDTHEIDLRAYVDSPGKPGNWWHYVLGPIAMIRDLAPELPGLDLSVQCEVPAGAGLSSSAAIEVATLRALNQHFDLQLEPIEIARLCQRAEHRYAGVLCGLMDQAASVLAEPGQLLAFDCRDETGSFIGGIPGTSLIVLDSGVRHALGESAYGDRREAIERASEKLGCSLRELSDRDGEPDLQMLMVEERDATRHVLSEMRRVRAALDAIRNRRPESLGKLLNDSHTSLRDTLRVSCSDVDEIVVAAQSTTGVYGARMIGGGFGGCILILTDCGHEQEVIQRVMTKTPASHVLTHQW